MKRSKKQKITAIHPYSPLFSPIYFIDNNRLCKFLDVSRVETMISTSSGKKGVTEGEYEWEEVKIVVYPTYQLSLPQFRDLLGLNGITLGSTFSRREKNRCSTPRVEKG